MNYWVLYETATGVIVSCQLAAAAPFTAGSGEAILQLAATNAQAAQASAFPEWYLVQGGALVAQPYLTVAVTGAGPYTVTATVNGSATPTTATLAVSGTGTAQAPVTNGQAQWTVDVHPSLAAALLTATVTAAGCVTGTAAFGGTQAAAIGIQLYTPSGGNPTVAPVGAGSLAFLRAYYGTLVQQANVMGDLATADSLALHTLLAVVLPPLVSAGTVTLDATQTAALTYLTANLVPSLPATLENAAPSGTPSQPVALYAADQGITAQAFTDYAADVANIPGLA